jgi:DNA-binding Lrp family transcriptional regulator
MEFEDIAKELGISESSVRVYLSQALRKIEKAGELENFAAVVRLTAYEKEQQTYIRCGSIECRPEKWIF